MSKNANTTPEEAKAPEETNATAEPSEDTAAATTTEGAKKKTQADMEAILNRMAVGKMVLLKPIRAGGENVTELEYDFHKLTGWEYAEALDSDRSAKDPLSLSAKQAMALFAAAAGKATKGMDARDIMERMGAEDAGTAIRVASVFFKASASLGNKRISNA